MRFVRKLAEKALAPVVKRWAAGPSAEGAAAKVPIMYLGTDG